MKYIKLFGIALAAILVLAVAPTGAFTTTMPGGTTSETKDGASQTTGSACQFVDSRAVSGAAATYLIADIHAYAGTSGKGTALVTVNVPADATGGPSKTVDNTLATVPEDSTLTVNANGVVTAKVVGKDVTKPDANVMAFSQIYSIAEVSATSISGQSRIYSAIGAYNPAAPVVLGTGNVPTGVLGAATGQFEAESYAKGTAGYIVTDDIMAESAPVGKPNLKVAQTVKGQVTGTTTLSADTTLGTTVHGAAAGGAPIQPAEAYLKSSSSVTKTAADNAAFLADNQNGVKVGAAISCVDPTFKESTVAGTAAGTDSANAREKYSDCVPGSSCDETVYEVNTDKTAVISADVSVSDDFDDARASAEVAPHAEITVLPASTTYKVTNNANTDSTTIRHFEDSTVPAFGRSFITSGNWNANAEKNRFTLIAGVVTNDNINAVVSGKLGTVGSEWYQSEGMGGGAFLMTEKISPAKATNLLTQEAKVVDTAGVRVQSTGSTFIGDAIGPKMSGADPKDGSGLYAAYRDLKMSTEVPGVTTPKVVSTDVAAINTYYWIDGTSSAAYLGYGLVVPTSPVFVGSLVSTYNPPSLVYTNSPTERETKFTGSTLQ